MAHEITKLNGLWSFAQADDQPVAWHALGQRIAACSTVAERATAALLDFKVLKIRSQYIFNGELLDSDVFHNVCSDTGQSLGVFSERYKVHQPREILEMFERLISVDDRFSWYSAAALKNRSVVFNCAKFSQGLEAAGEPHNAYLTSATSFDGTLATGNTASMEATVCNNTLTWNRQLGKTVRVRHNSALTDAKTEALHNELMRVITSFDQYKAMADAMAITKQSEADTELLLKSIFFGKDKIPTDESDMKTQTANQLNSLFDCYRQTIKEGREKGTVWATLNAVTRYVDHARTTRDHSGEGELMSRFASAQFGSGQILKQRAVDYLIEYASENNPSFDEQMQSWLKVKPAEMLMLPAPDPIPEPDAPKAPKRKSCAKVAA
jgi:phage/plasmid-like protein (TIGR03299 family)